MTTELKIQDKVSATISSLMLNHPELATVLLDVCRYKFEPKFPTAATNGRDIIVGDWWAGLVAPERLGVIAHEILHVIFDHLPRTKRFIALGIGPDGKPFQPKKMNKAQDYVINDLLLNSGFILPANRLHDTSIGTMNDSAEDVYCRLPDTEDDGGGGHGGFDEHDLAGDPATAPSPQEVQQAVVSGLQAAKQMGKGDGALSRVLGGLVEPKIHWYERLRDYMTTYAGNDELSWRRINRRQLAVTGVAWPGMDGFRMNNMVVAIDVSGSISPAEYDAFISETGRIIDEVKPRNLYACFWDTKAKIVKVDSLDELERADVYGGGGTVYDCALDEIDREGVVPDVAVCLTDGDVSVSRSSVPYPHVTVTTGRDMPFGANIKLELD